MELRISDKKKAAVNPGMNGLFFEDINYAADGGLYAEMIENRSFEFVEAFGEKGDYYTQFDGGYGWSLYPADADASIAVVSGSPLCEENPHYLRLTAKTGGAGFANQAYSGICLKHGKKYNVHFYARTVSGAGAFLVQVVKDGVCAASGKVTAISPRETKPNHWEEYRLTLTAQTDVRGAQFVILVEETGIAEFDFISMMPADAVEGVFRKDLFELLKDLKPGFVRFPGGCIVEGNTLANRYRFKDTLKRPEARKSNWNRWAVHGNCEENGYHSRFAHYNQTYGLGYYEYFLLCEKIDAKPLPVMNVGMACQYQSYEWIDLNDSRFQAFVQDALDLISFANDPADTRWGKVRAELGHPEPFGLELLGIGNEQWQTEEADFFSRYEAFEKAIHAVYPQIRLIGSAGPDVHTERYAAAWDFYDRHTQNPDFVYAVDEHYYMKPEWFFEHTDFYDSYPRSRKVFSGEYAAHPQGQHEEGKANILRGALAEAAFLTGVERNADVVLLSSYAPLFARCGFSQWQPDLIWFDEETAYGTPSYYVQKLYSTNQGSAVLDLQGQEKELAAQGIYVNAVLDEASGEIIVKLVNVSGKTIPVSFAQNGRALEMVSVQLLGGTDPESGNSLEQPEAVCIRTSECADTVENNTFAVYRLN